MELRAFVPEMGVPEDPVTGSLNASIAQWLMASERVGSRYVASQGTALGRAGRVFIQRIDGAVWVGGDCRTLVSGTLAL